MGASLLEQRVSEEPFGARLRGLRRAAGLTMEQLAEASGVSARAISDMERGHSRAPQARPLAALTAALGAGEDALAADRPARTGGRPRACELPPARSPTSSGVRTSSGADLLTFLNTCKG